VPVAREDEASLSSMAGLNGGDHDLAWWVGAGLEASLKARAPGLHASTPVVRQLATRIGDRLGLEPKAVALLDLAVRVRDVGMLALPDTVVLATGALSPEQWALVNQHPILGAELIERLAPVAGAADCVRAHHERWDGGGYPDGRRGNQIPLASRVIAACDAFVAMASDRPHRRGVGAESALEQMYLDEGSQFDPRIVHTLSAALADSDVRQEPRRGRVALRATGRPPQTRADSTRGRRDLMSTLAEFDVVPAFAPAYDRVLVATAEQVPVSGELVEAIESDTGLTVAVLRRAQDRGARRRIASVTDAVAALSADEIREAIEPLPRAEFPWRTTELDVLMHRARVHAQAVTRVTIRVAREVEARDEIAAAALLHDVGALVLGRADNRYARIFDPRTAAPEERIKLERTTYGLDHASLGGLLLGRWGLPKQLAGAVAAHHKADDGDEVATYVRLADMIAHHIQSDRVDRKLMLRLANACGLTSTALRDVLFDLPHSGGSDRRRAEPSPLSRRETGVLRLLAQGKVYKVIAIELGLSVSTVRTHLHNSYSKMGVADRAQAVLKATEMGWI
jgi:HD-GYP domain-containing protein (c-di-GMP phosphodiesterase class II)/DNA-binding CsgD family transcriptional regulator